MFFFFFDHVPCFVILVWRQYSRWVCIKYEDLSLSSVFIIYIGHEKNIKALQKTPLINSDIFPHVGYCCLTHLTHSEIVCLFFKTESSQPNWTNEVSINTATLQTLCIMSSCLLELCNIWIFTFTCYFVETLKVVTANILETDKRRLTPLSHLYETSEAAAD